MWKTTLETMHCPQCRLQTVRRVFHFPGSDDHPPCVEVEEEACRKCHTLLEFGELPAASTTILQQIKGVYHVKHA